MIIVSDIHFGKEDPLGVEILLHYIQQDKDALLILPGIVP